MSRARRAIVEVRWAAGKPPARKVVIDPGGTLSIGRAERIDHDGAASGPKPRAGRAGPSLVVPDDRSMGNRHCELRWDGKRCHVSHRARTGEGTFLNGEQVTEAEVKNGAWIRAGSTVLSVYFEGATPPRGESGLKGDGTDRLTATQADALAALEETSGDLFAVLDAARTLRVIEVLRESVETYRSLYEGPKGDALAMQAPYLVVLPAGSRLLEQLVLEGWSRRWGIYLTSKRPFDEVRRQLRRLLMVHDDRTGRSVYFRFYDPRMLRLFLPTCATRQREQIFGEIDAFLVPGRDGEVVRFTAHEPPAALTPARAPDLAAEELDA